jgi:hypothetical protein
MHLTYFAESGLTAMKTQYFIHFPFLFYLEVNVELCLFHI